MNYSLEKFEIKKNLTRKSLTLLHLQNCMNLSSFFKNKNEICKIFSPSSDQNSKLNNPREEGEYRVKRQMYLRNEKKKDTLIKKYIISHLRSIIKVSWKNLMKIHARDDTQTRLHLSIQVRSDG